MIWHDAFAKYSNEQPSRFDQSKPDLMLEAQRQRFIDRKKADDEFALSLGVDPESIR